ncbi:MAG: acyl-CoA dehydrogenase family protein [Candidatus Limnocylindria bacterium]|jgi:alkylation response protein AidB-like acyl-CoA dehydrogenase
MNFGFTEEQELLRKTARDFLAEHAPIQQVRAIMDGPQRYAEPLWRRMAELGWLGLAFPERFGGAGLSMVELGIVLEELGRTLAPVPFLPTLIAGFAILELGDEKQQQDWLPRICSGRALATLAITEERGTEQPADFACTATRVGSGWELRGRKLFVPDADIADLLIVAARVGPGLGLFCVPRSAAGVGISALRSMDALRQLYKIELEGVRLPEASLLGANTDAGSKLERVLDRGRVMVCAEMVGGAEKCLEDSVRHAKERVQFGKPIGVNQAIKHKCADMLFEVESAKSITYYAAWAAREDNAEAPIAAAMAKAYVSDAYRHASAENIQIHGGVGFTWEYDCHLYFKRAKSDEAWLGDGSYHRERVAQMLNL